jgi:hypothetical protein
MKSELPELDSRAAADEMAKRTANSFSGILLGIAVVAPWLLFTMSIISVQFLWLTVLDLMGTHAGLLLMLRGYRDGNSALKRWGAGVHAVTLLLCLVILAILQ